MSSRVQVIVSDVERERFRRQAEAEGMSLSSWLRHAGKQLLAERHDRRRLTTAAELRSFFANLSDTDGVEPEWSAHRQVIEESIRRGLPES